MAAQPTDPPERDSEPSAHTSARQVASEALSEIGGLERKLPRTVMALVFKPGFLTEQRRLGHGDAYVSPVRLYAVSAAAYYALSFTRNVPGVDLGFVYITDFFGRVPEFIDPPLLLIAAVPLFALLLTGLFGGNAVMAAGDERTTRAILDRYGEFLVFALYFQSLLFWVFPVLRILPLPSWGTVPVALLIFVLYLSVGARRLWGVSVAAGALKAVFTYLVYLLVLALAAGGATWVEGVLGLGA